MKKKCCFIYSMVEGNSESIIPSVLGAGRVNAFTSTDSNISSIGKDFSSNNVFYRM